MGAMGQLPIEDDVLHGVVGAVGLGGGAEGIVAAAGGGRGPREDSRRPIEQA